LLLAAKFFGNGHEIRLVRFQEAENRSQKRWVIDSAPKFVGPNSGQVEKTLRPTPIAERCGKGSEGERHRIIWYPGVHSLECTRAG
jgi:hypothetical protein